MPDYPLTWHRASRTRRPRRTTPEGAATKSIKDYLESCALGRVIRQQVGQVMVGEHQDRPLRFGKAGDSDWRVELNGDSRCIFVEVKPVGWKPPSMPPDWAGQSSKHYFRTLSKDQKHYADQFAELEWQKSRGNFALFATTPMELYDYLTRVGFKVPRPGARRAA